MILESTDRNNFSLKFKELPVFLRIQVIDNISDREQRKCYDKLKPAVEALLCKFPNQENFCLPESSPDLFQCIYKFSNQFAPEYVHESSRFKFGNIVDFTNIDPSVAHDFYSFLKHFQIDTRPFDQSNALPTYRSIAAFVIGWFSSELFKAKKTACNNLYVKSKDLAVSAYGDVLYDNYLVSNHLLPDVEKQLFGVYSDVFEDRGTFYTLANVQAYEQFKNYFEHLTFAKMLTDLNAFHYFYLGYQKEFNLICSLPSDNRVLESIIIECSNQFISFRNIELENLVKLCADADVRDGSAIARIREAFWYKLFSELYQDRLVPAIEHTAEEFYTSIAEQEFVVENITEYIRRKTLHVLPSAVKSQNANALTELMQETDKFLNLEQARHALMDLANLKSMNDARTLSDVCLSEVLQPCMFEYQITKEFVQKIGYAIYHVEKLLRCNINSKLTTDDLLSAYLEVDKLAKPFFVHPDLFTTEIGYPLLSQIFGINTSLLLNFEIYLKCQNGKNPVAHLWVSDDLIAEIFE